MSSVFRNCRSWNALHLHHMHQLRKYVISCSISGDGDVIIFILLLHLYFLALGGKAHCL